MFRFKLLPQITEVAAFGSATYGSEECVAEMTAACLCGITGIENRTIDSSAAYIAECYSVNSAMTAS
jgi:antirestriction protein ArdC